MTAGQYVYTFTVLGDDFNPDDNVCIQGYEVYNYEVCAEEMECIDHTGQGSGHWVEESCCGGYFWEGDPVTTLYGVNWTDTLYLRNSTGGLTFDMTAYADACIEFDTWFQFFDLGDYGLVQYSDDGGYYWYTLANYTMNSTDIIWGSDMYGFFHDDLCVGYTTPDMQFRFLFVSNATGIARGWILDNIEVNDGGATTIFGPDEAVDFDNFYRSELQYGCWWFSPDIFGYTPGWGNFDPYKVGNYGLDTWYAPNQNDSVMWCFDISGSFYGILQFWRYADLNPQTNDTVYLEVSTDGGATWEGLNAWSGWTNFGNDYYTLGDYMDTQELCLRWRMESDHYDMTDTYSPNFGYDFEDPCFWGMLDETAPVTKAQLTGTFDEQCHWYTSCVKIKLDATDDISGVAATYYELDGVKYTYTGLVSICTDGEHTFCYWSVDNEGNVEEKICLPEFRIDQSGPTVSITGPATGYLYLFGNQLMSLKSGKTIVLFNGIPVTATATAADNPVKVVQFFLDDVLMNEDSTAPYSATLSAKHSGPATIKVVAIDTMGRTATDTLAIDNYFKLF
jgi:hypothetical protein